MAIDKPTSTGSSEELESEFGLNDFEALTVDAGMQGSMGCEEVGQDEYEDYKPNPK